MRTALKWTGIVIGAVVVVAVLCLALLDWNRLRGPISRLASEKSGRPVSINGDLQVHPWSPTPTVSVSGLTVGSPKWVTQEDSDLLDVDHISLKIALWPLLRGDVVLPELIVDRPKVFIYRTKDGRANWQSEREQPERKSSKPLNLPAIRKLVMTDGKLRVVDEVRKLNLTSAVAANESNESEPQPFHVHATGDFNQSPFELLVTGDSLLRVEPRKPYPFQMRLTAGNTQLAVNGSIAKPFDLGHVQADTQMSGDDLADLYALTGLALPNTPPFDVSGRLIRDGTKIAFNNVNGKIGDSDVHGDVSVETSGARPKLDAKLASKSLDIDDLAAPLGAAPSAQQGETVSPKQKAVAQAMKAQEKLFPDATLQVDRLRGMDGTLDFKADSVKARKIPLKKVAAILKLENGLLAIDPLTFDMLQGRIGGNVHVDARKDVPETRFDLHMTGVQLSQFKPAKSEVAPLEGVLLARARLKGQGNSVAKVMSTADGSATAVLPHGQIREAFAELTGINVARGLGLLLSKDQEHVDVRCGVADFKVQNGKMAAQNLVFDTNNVLITGKGDINLQDESLNVQIKGQPKKLRLFRVHSPINLTGHLRKPSIGIRADEAIAQGGVAAAIGAVAAPLAAVIAFVDPGLAKDADCGSLLAEAGTNQVKDEKGKRVETGPRPDTSIKTATTEAKSKQR